MQDDSAGKKAAAQKPRLPKPDWLKVRAPAGENYGHIKNMLGELKLATVCQEAKCPNMGECWSGGTAFAHVGALGFLADRCEF